MKNWIFVFLASTTFGLLPPLSQSTRELRELINDPRLYENLGGSEIIQKIIRTENGYLVVTQNYEMAVDVHYQRREERRIGPAQFELEFQAPRSRVRESFSK